MTADSKRIPQEWDGRWCHDDPVPDPCPLCGATIAGNDKRRGVCGARECGPRPRPLVELILVDKRTGERVA